VPPKVSEEHLEMVSKTDRNGVCELCREYGELQDSHLLPKSAYKYAASQDPQYGRSPVKIDVGDGSAGFGDKQIKIHLLCVACEQRLSRLGETPVSRLWNKHGVFPLRDQLLASKPVANDERISIFNPGSLAPSDLYALEFTAFSIFWRAHVWRWARGGDPYRKALGAEYSEKIRSYLLGGDRPVGAFFFIEVDSGHLGGMFSLPVSKKVRGGRAHIFDLLGIRFTLLLGRHIGENLVAAHTLMGASTVLTLEDFSKGQYFLELAKAVQTKVTARGRLAGLEAREAPDSP
jgi:hypothetical protein